MQDDRFDRLARFLARGRTRRRFVTLMAGAALAGAAPRASDAQDVCLVLNADCQFHGTPCCPPTECISDVFTGLGTCQTPTTATAQPAAPPTVSPAPAGASAAMWGGDPARTGVQPGSAPMSKPALAWSFATGGESAPPIIADGVVYAGSVTDPSQTGGGFFALDAATGSAHWSIAAPNAGNGWGPAAEAGVKERDRITAVDGAPVSAAAVGVTPGPSRAYSLALDGQSVGPGGWATHDRLGLRGPVGSTVRVTIQPPRGPARDVTLTRALVTTRYVAESHRLAADPEIGYLRIPAFLVSDMAAQVEAQLRLLLAAPRPLRGLVIDLRENSGGFTAVGDAIIGQFVSGNAGSYVDRSGASTPHVIQAGDLKAQLDKTAVVVLTDADSFSESEVFAATLQRAGRAKVVGTRTPGVIESSEFFDGMGGLRMEVATQATLLADGVNLEGKGVTPDVTVSADWTRFDEASDPDIVAAIALLRGGAG